MRESRLVARSVAPKKKRYYCCRNRHLLHPVETQVVLGPTHAQPQADQPPQLPCPQIERAHLVQRDPHAENPALQVVYETPESELCEQPECEAASKGVLPPKTLP